MATARERLQSIIAGDAFLVSAKLEDNLIDHTLHCCDNHVAESVKVLTNFAHWHIENLGHPAARVSITHVHAYYLMKLFFSLPQMVSGKGDHFIVHRFSSDRGVVPKQFAAFMLMFIFYRIRLPGRFHRGMTLVQAQNFQLVNMRLSTLKALNDAGAAKRPTPVVIFNAGIFFMKSFKAMKRFLPDYDLFRFVHGEEIFEYAESSVLPTDFGGTVTEQQLDADIEDFIIQQYALEGLRYSPISLSDINWKTYRPPGMDFMVRPESAISARSIDFDAIGAALAKFGYAPENADERGSEAA
ncbi:hypothetical protein HDU84_007391 [Entophlyctis sp. JEL0112]|nr:hypothetical protein HDU84_007391 [Entophlyctis sp. JEL0112]